MRTAIISLILLSFLACGSDKQAERFNKSIIDTGQIGTLKRLTDDDRSIYPVFSPGDTIAYYQRLLVTDVVDTMYFYDQEVIKPYGINIGSGELYTLSSKAAFPSNRVIAVSELPTAEGEETVWGVASPDSLTLAFESIPYKSKEMTHIIYLAQGNSIRRLTFGKTSCFIDRFSNTGRYLTAIMGNGPTSILIFDLVKNQIYKIDSPKNDSAVVNYMTVFSRDDSMMLFVRSKMEYQWGKDYFGDIWLLKFNN